MPATTAARMIQEALGIESDDDANYVFPRAEYEEKRRLIGR